MMRGGGKIKTSLVIIGKFYIKLMMGWGGEGGGGIKSNKRVGMNHNAYHG